MHRLYFDYQIEDRALGEDALEDKLFDKYKEEFNEEDKKGIVESARDQPDWRWLQHIQRLQEALKLLRPE
jgi:hypothetical protein